MNPRKYITTHPTVLRWIIFSIAVLTVFFFRPEDSTKRLHYELNRPWIYSPLYAPFDIPVNIDSISAQAITDSITNNFEPVYRRDIASQNAAIATFNERLDPSLSQSRRDAIARILSSIFARGIIDNPAEAPQSIRLLNDNIAQSINTSSLLSPRMAYSMIDSLTRSDEPLRSALAKASVASVLIPNIIPDSVETDRLRNELLQTALAPVGVIQQGVRIIDRGDIVTPQLYTNLRTYEIMSAERGDRLSQSRIYNLIGSLFYFAILFAALYLFIYFYRPQFYNSIPSLLLLVLTIVVTVLVAFGMKSVYPRGIYMVPFTIVPIIILVFLDSRTAFFASTITILLVSCVSAYPWEFITLQTCAALTALVSTKELSKRSHLVRTAFLVFLTYLICYMAFELMRTGSFSLSTTALMVLLLFFNAIFISFVYFLIFLLEKIFGLTSSVTLVELADINHPILRELSEECPGTFQHSMSVSNLATVAAAKIGANVQLVRTGALYHDIGKLSNPAFFTENQHGVNPHSALSPLQSARIVIGHVADGLARAEKGKIPEAIRNFIAQHHGRGTARYFFTTYANQHPGEEIDPAPFSYPGPNPQSREASIVMMADAVEAASRSLPQHTSEAIASLVNRIIDTQIAEGLHAESPISFRDVTEIKNAFISRLRTMYHARISYPEAIKPAQQPSSQSPAQ